jgi:O-antigen/teichoic acid export membrane protein
MRRLILGYAPANLAPAIVSICGIFVFTRLLSTQEFGAYNLAFSVTMVAQSVLFFAPALAVTRFYTGAQASPEEAAGFLKTMYLLLLCVAGLALAAAAAAGALAGGELIGRQLGLTGWLIVPLLLLRALVATNQTVHRAAGRMGRFNLIECLNAVLGLAAGVGLSLLGVPGGAAVMAGLVVGAAVCAAIDLRLLACLGARARVDRAVLAQVLRFCWPLVLAYAVGCTLQYADRFIVDSWDGTAALGVYVVAFSIVDRPISLICLSVTAGTFQMAVDTYVREGAEAGRIQAGRNGAVLLGLALPACVGLMLTSKSVAAVLVGPSFDDGVAMLVPIMAMTALLRGVGAHYVDHAFHLSNHSFRLFAVYAPSAIGNIVLSALLVPRYGMVSAAWAALACQAAALLAGWAAAERVLPLWLPARETAKIVACVVAMAALLLALPLPVGWIGLFGGTAAGVAAYAAAATALDLGGVRGMLAGRLRPREPACPT